MGSTSNPLNTPLTKPPFSLTHRIALAPMTRSRANNDTAIINPSAATYYAERTTPGSLLISEGTVIHPRGKGYPRTPGIWNHEQALAWKPITEAVHEKGGTFFVQLWHVGRVSVPSLIGGQKPFSSTGVRLQGRHVIFGGEVGDDKTEEYVDSHAMTREDIRDVVGHFAHAAKLAIEVAGFDGVEIHGANGYLLDTFVHDNINTRDDEYGGSLEGRLKFPLEIVDAVVEAVGREMTAMRLAPFHNLQETNDSNPTRTFSTFCERLEERGLAYVHIVERRYDQLSKEGAFSGSIERKGRQRFEGKAREDRALPEARSLWTFRRILKNTVLIDAGGYDGVSAAQAVEEGLIDLAAFGRHFTSNPDLPERLFKGFPLTKYHRPSFYTSGPEGYLGWSRYQS